MTAAEAKEASMEDLEGVILDSWYDRGYDKAQSMKCYACGAEPGRHDDDCVIGKASPALEEILRRLDVVMEKSGAGWE